MAVGVFGEKMAKDSVHNILINKKGQFDSIYINI